jgi:hypothetical protein
VKPAPFAYVRAASLDQVFDLPARHGDEAYWPGPRPLPMLELRLAEADRCGTADFARCRYQAGVVGIAVQAWVVTAHPVTPERVLHAWARGLRLHALGSAPGAQGGDKNDQAIRDRVRQGQP